MGGQDQHVLWVRHSNSDNYITYYYVIELVPTTNSRMSNTMTTPLMSTVGTSDISNLTIIIIAVTCSAVIVVVVLLLTSLIIGIIYRSYHIQTLPTTDQDIPIYDSIAYGIRSVREGGGVNNTNLPETTTATTSVDDSFDNDSYI